MAWRLGGDCPVQDCYQTVDDKVGSNELGQVRLNGFATNVSLDLLQNSLNPHTRRNLSKAARRRERFL